MTKQVQLSDRAYNLLKQQKRDKESFSDTVERLCAPKKDLQRFLNAPPMSDLSLEEWLALAKQMKGPVL